MRPALVLATAVNFFDFYALSSFFLLPRLLKELGAGEDFIGAAMGSTSAVNLLAIPLAGILADRIGRKPLLIFGSLFMAATSYAFVGLHGLSYAFAGLRGLHGIAFASFFVAGMATVADEAEHHERAHLLGIFGLFALVTHALAPAVGEWIVAAAGFDGLWKVASASAAIGALLALALPARKPAEHAGPPATMAILIRRRELLAPVLLSGVLATGFGAAIQFLAAFAVVRGLPAVAPFFLAFVASSMVVRLVGGRHWDRLGPKRVSVPFALIYAAGVGGLSVVHGPAGLIACGLLFGLAQGVTYPALSALVIGRVGPQERGKAVGLYSGAFGGGMMVSAFGYGALAEAAGYGVMYAVAGGVMVLGTAIFVLIDRS